MLGSRSYGLSKEEKMNRLVPCTKDCPGRAPGCGATCEALERYTKARDAEYATRAREIDLNEKTRGGARNCRVSARAKKIGREHMR